MFGSRESYSNNIWTIVIVYNIYLSKEDALWYNMQYRIDLLG